MPKHIQRPPYADKGSLPEWDSNPQIHSAEGIERMRAAGQLAAKVLAHAGSLVKVRHNWLQWGGVHTVAHLLGRGRTH